MAVTVHRAASKGGSLTKHGKHLVARAMYQKGLHFIGAAILLEQKGGYQGVVLHLLCQGIEVTLKGLLLFANYDKYKPRLIKPLGHNIEKVANAALSEFKLMPLRKDTKEELAQLNRLYSQHLLRYGTVVDILIDPRTISCDRTFRRIAAAIRLADSRLDL